MAPAIPFLAYDVFHFAQDAQAKRHPCVNPPGQSFDQAGTHHQLMADDLGIGGRFFQRGNEIVRRAHGSLSSGLRDESPILQDSIVE